MKKITNKKVLFGLALFFITIVSGVIIWQLIPKHFGCTTEAKICPNGSSVGRTGPSCEFSKCPIINQIAPLCDKQKNCCTKNEDCQYIWFAGGCYTPEYIKIIMDRCEDGSGPCPSEAEPRDNITCACENNKCITNN
jgi:hypothetical protein